MPHIEYRERDSDPSIPVSIAGKNEKFFTARSHVKDGMEKFEIEEIEVVDPTGQIRYRRSKLVGPEATDRLPYSETSDVIMTGSQINEFPQVGELNGLSFTFALTEEERGPSVG